jgi:anti-sigma B factor antagonist
MAQDRHPEVRAGDEMNQSGATKTVEIVVRVETGAAVVTIVGSLADDGNTVAKEAFLKLLPQKPGRILVDVAGMEYISSSGIGVLVSALRRCRQAGIGMTVCGMRPEIAELFKLTRLDQVFDIAATIQDAEARARR